MPSMTRPGQNQEARTQSRFPLWVAGIQCTITAASQGPQELELGQASNPVALCGTWVCSSPGQMHAPAYSFLCEHVFFITQFSMDFLIHYIQKVQFFKIMTAKNLHWYLLSLMLSEQTSYTYIQDFDSCVTDETCRILLYFPKTKEDRVFIVPDCI